MSYTLMQVKRSARRPRPLALALAAALTTALMASAPALAQQLLAPTAPVANLSQSYLAAQFGQWALKHGTDTDLNVGGADPAAGSQGSYVFLGGSWGQVPLVRNITVQSDQALFINLVSIIDWMGNGLLTEAAIREEAANLIGINPTLSLTVNGAAATLPAGYSSLQAFRQSSPLFPLSFGPGNLAGWPESVVPAIVDGYFVAMQALAEGSYQLHVTTFNAGIGPFTGYTFTQDVTYNITSVPEPATWAGLSLGLLAIGASARRRRRVDAH